MVWTSDQRSRHAASIPYHISPRGQELIRNAVSKIDRHMSSIKSTRRHKPHTPTQGGYHKTTQRKTQVQNPDQGPITKPHFPVYASPPLGVVPPSPYPPAVLPIRPSTPHYPRFRPRTTAVAPAPCERAVQRWSRLARSVSARAGQAAVAIRSAWQNSPGLGRASLGAR